MRILSRATTDAGSLVARCFQRPRFNRAANRRPGPWASPFLRWAGSKRKLLPLLVPLIPASYNCYFEPFVGSACLFFAVRPRRAVLSDINADLIGAYSQVAAHPRRTWRIVSTLPKGAQAYYHIRRSLLQASSPQDSAARFIYLNRHCFNGVYRTNKTGMFNVPIG